jgi:hypothetical protein
MTNEHNVNTVRRSWSLLVIDLLFMLTRAPRLSVSTNIWTMKMWIAPPWMYNKPYVCLIFFLAQSYHQLHRYVMDFRKLCQVISFSNSHFWRGIRNSDNLASTHPFFNELDAKKSRKSASFATLFIFFLQLIISLIRKIRSEFLEHSETLNCLVGCGWIPKHNDSSVRLWFTSLLSRLRWC